MFYCVESTFHVVQPSTNKKRTYKSFAGSENERNSIIEGSLRRNATYVKVKKISESQYIKAFRDE